MSEQTQVDVFDNQSYDDMLAANAAANVPRVDDDNYPRYAMSGLLPIPLYRQIGNNSFGDFNPKDPATGLNTVNHAYYPAFTLMPLFTRSFPIPYENQATESDEPPISAPFDYNSFKDQPKNGYDRLNRSASQCAEVFLRENALLGGAILYSLIGYHVADDDKGMRAARALFDLILPYRDQDEFPETVRIKNGVPFKGPFLDQMIAYLKTRSLERLSANGVDITDAEAVEMKTYTEIRKVLEANLARANRILNETEAEIRNPAEIKKTYDAPNLDVMHAPVATDLYCLAHAKRTEIDDKQLEASANIGRGLADPMTQVVDKLAQAVDRLGGTPATAGNPASVLTMDQVEQLLRNQREEMSKEFDAKLAMAATASAAPTAPETAQPDSSTDEAKTTTKKK